MKCRRTIIHCVDGKPSSYSLVLEGFRRPVAPKGTKFKETSFKEAYGIFPSIRKHWNEDGSAKE